MGAGCIALKSALITYYTGDTKKILIFFGYLIFWQAQ